MLGRSQQRQRRRSFLQRRPTPSSSSSASSSNSNSLSSTSLALASAPDGYDRRHHPPRNGNDSDKGQCRTPSNGGGGGGNNRLVRPDISTVTPNRLFRKGSGRLSLPSSLSRRVNFLGTPSRERRGQTRPDDGGNDGGGHRRGGKLFVPSQTAKSMRFELENLPLPATVASAAIALMGSEDVVDSFVEAGYFRRGEGDRGGDESDEGYHDNGLYLALEGFHLTPLQTRHDRKVQFQRALQELIVSGNRDMLYSWEEAKVALSDVFVFPRVDLSAGENASEMLATDAAFTANDNEGSATRSSMVSVSDVSGEELIGQHDPVTATATTATEILDLTSPKPNFPTGKFHPTPTKPLKSQRTPPHKRASASTTSVKSPTPKQQRQKQQQQHSASKLSLAAYQKILQKELGLEKFIRIFNRAISIASRPSIANRTSADIAKLDRRITALESQRRSTLRDEATISEYQLRQKEKEAKLAASKLLRPLTSDEQYLVQKALYAIGPPDDILASLDADSVQRASMQTLQPGRWINDEIINYFLKNCLAKRDERLCSTQPGRKRSHFFNSYFVQTMFDDKNSDPAKRGRYNYNNVKRWSKKVPGKDIFNLRYIVCPINLDNMHWTSAVIFMEEKKICYYDSLGGTEWTKLEGLLEYVKDEHKAKKGKELEGWEDWELLGCPEDVPRQLNGYDCGVFTCMFADFISKDCPLSFNQQHVNQCRERIALSIMKNCAVD